MLFRPLRPSESTNPSSPDNAKTTTDGLLRGKRAEGGTVGHIARGTVIGHYTILDHLGSGGMASVYSAYDTQLERIVAIKMLRAEIEDVRVRMLREAQAMARLKHEHVVTVYEVGTFEHRIYIAMEFVDGKTLSSWSREPRPWRELLKILKAAGRGLAAAHDAGRFSHWPERCAPRVAIRCARESSRKARAMRSAPRTDGRKTSPRWTGGWGKRLSKGGAGCWLWVACPFPGRSADVHRVGRSLASETGAGLERYERYATGGQPPLSRWPPRPSPTGAYTRRAE